MHGDRVLGVVSPSGRVHLGNLREFLTVHFVAEELRRRGRAGAAPAHLGRLRPVPQGAGGRRPVVGRAHRPAAVRGTRPVGLPPSWAEHFKAPLRAALPRWAWRWRRSPRPSGTPPAPTASRCSSPSRTAHDIEAVLARYRTKKPAPATALRPGGRRRSPTRVADDDEEPERRHRAGALPVQALLPQLRPRHHHGHAVRRRRPPTCPTPAPTGHAGTTNLATQHEGKLVWKVDWPMRWAFEHVDFEPAGIDHATPGSSYTVGHELVEKVFGMPRAGVGRLRLRRLRRRAEDVVVRGRRADRGRRAAGPRGADPALALRPPAAQAGLRHRLRPRGRPAVRRVGRAGPQGRRPGQARRPGARLRARLVDDGRGRAADSARRRTVPGAVVGRRRHRRLAPSRSAGSSARRARARLVDDLEPRLAGRWRGPASTSTRPTARPCGRPRTRRRSPRCDDEQRLAAAAARRPARPAGPRAR